MYVTAQAGNVRNRFGMDQVEMISIFEFLRLFRFETWVALYVDCEERRIYHGIECRGKSMGISAIKWMDDVV